MSLNPRIVKVVCIGDTNTGKSSIVQTFVDKETDIDRLGPTVAVDFAVKCLTVNGQQVKLTIWDTAGQERFRSLSSSYYRGAEVLLVVYDVTNRDSFQNIEYWIDEARENLSKKPIMVLVGNKIDLEEERQVDRKEGIHVAKNNRMLFIETSARTHHKIAEPFTKALKKIDLSSRNNGYYTLKEKKAPGGMLQCCV